MEIYLIRHTKPDIAKGTCYGQADIGTVESFLDEAACIRPHLPEQFDQIFSSPLRRCRELAEHLFPEADIRFDERLKEIHCGEWELRSWDEIEPGPLQAWMNDFVNYRIPGGESYTELYSRVVDFFSGIPGGGRVAIVAHGGVIRSLLAHIENVDLKDSFNRFPIHYGCVVRLHRNDERLTHTFLHNVQQEKEQHRPAAKGF